MSFGSSIISSLCVNPVFQRQLSFFQTFAVVGVNRKRTSVDFVWTHVFSNFQPTAKLVEVNSTQRRSTKRFRIEIKANFKNKDILTAYRKLYWCVLVGKDTKHIMINHLSLQGSQKLKAFRCEKYCETRELSSYLSTYLEDLRLDTTLNVHHFNIASTNYLLHFFNIPTFKIRP